VPFHQTATSEGGTEGEKLLAYTGMVGAFREILARTEGLAGPYLVRKTNPRSTFRKIGG